MTVEELKKKLNDYPDNADVIVSCPLFFDEPSYLTEDNGEVYILVK